MKKKKWKKSFIILSFSLKLEKNIKLGLNQLKNFILWLDQIQINKLLN